MSHFASEPMTFKRGATDLNDSFAMLGFKLGNYLIHEGVRFYELKFLNNHPEK